MLIEYGTGTVHNGRDNTWQDTYHTASDLLWKYCTVVFRLIGFDCQTRCPVAPLSNFNLDGRVELSIHLFCIDKWIDRKMLHRKMMKRGTISLGIQTIETSRVNRFWLWTKRWTRILTVSLTLWKIVSEATTAFSWACTSCSKGFTTHRSVLLSPIWISCRKMSGHTLFFQNFGITTYVSCLEPYRPVSACIFWSNKHLNKFQNFFGTIF